MLKRLDAAKFLLYLGASFEEALFRRELRRRRYLGASSEEGAISTRAPNKALPGCKQRRRRYLNPSSEEVAISAAEVEPFSDLASR